MDLELDETSREWQERARRFAEDYLQPHEIEAELDEGRLPPDTGARNKARALELGFSAMDVPQEYGGLGLPIVTQAAVWEQLGRTTNALSWCFAEPQSWMFAACSEEQIERYILPLMRGERHDCYAITEAGPGSDVAALTATAARDGDDYLLNGEKWYVTSANLADFFWFQGRVDGGEEQALFFVDKDTPGIEMIACPHFSHTFAAHHPTYRFADVRVPAAARVGRAGDGMTYTRAWFRRERLMIGARCCGAAARLIEEATVFAAGREVGGEPLAKKQAIQALLADSVTELWAARLMTYEAAAAQDRGEDVKTLHARCSLVKLYASEMANRVADRAVQIFGGRGYMRENVAERFFRELRVDRIWEGTSEIQRQIIAGCLLKRGLDGM
ncbi:acyl-CoA dehydrogenase family protein [Lentisalinibacter sediminis]|uniref:acyl-CoA dehydrogenase family protein n=1 Tax=Lentisalinibacter sediminis TaxID=2992237 RepID=UPI00386C51FD